MSLPHEPSEVKAALKRQQWTLYARLGLKGASQGALFYPLRPFGRDRKPGSFVVYTDPDKAGGFVEYAKQKTGDVFGLIEFCLGLRDFTDAYWWAVDFLGLPREAGQGAHIRRRTVDQAEAERVRLARLEAERDEKKKRDAMSRCLTHLWLGLPASFVGTPAETYLREVRRLPLERLAHYPGAIRWAEAVDFIEPFTGEIRTWRHVMVSAISKGSDIVAVHRTFLRPDGLGKAEVSKAKTMKGPASGGAIRLSAGPSGLSPAKAAAKGRRDPLAIGEGIETSLSVACARRDLRVWAAGSLSLMGLIEWPACASAVVLLKDNDWKPEAQDAFARVEAHWRAQAAGRPLEVASPPPGINDFNDWARAAA